MIERDLVLVGFGNAGRRFVQLLDERADRLAAGYGVRTRVVGIATRRLGAVFAPDGLDALRAAGEVAAGRLLDHASLGSGAVTCADVFDLIARAGASAPDGRGVLIETTTLNVEDGEPAASHLRAALDAGLHAITANKGPVACRYAEIAARAEAAGRTLRFEGAVMDGIPIFNLARETLRGVEVTGLRGIVNSTTQYVLAEMEQGASLDAALAHMQRLGIAEADATLDVEGWDAAAKISALANVLMGAQLTPASVDRTGITALTTKDLRDAIDAGHRLRLVASARRVDDRVTARVAPTRVPASDLFACLPGMANALTFETDVLEDVTIVQGGGGLVQTAYALLSDLLSLPAPDRARP
jgi:homoserine dehydrogenase